MTHSYGICKRFISLNDALQCEGTGRHHFHEECVAALLGSPSGAQTGDLHCSLCKGTAPLRRATVSAFPPSTRSSASQREVAAPPALEMGSLGKMVASLLGKMTTIEGQLRDLSTIKNQLQDLSAIVPQLTALETKLTATSEALSSSVTELRGQQAALDRRVTALETGPASGSAHTELSGLASRLEALEREKRSSEIILFGLKESPSENLKDILSSIARVLGVEVGRDQILACFRIPTKGDRPRPLVVKFSSVELRNRLLGRGSVRGSAR